MKKYWRDFFILLIVFCVSLWDVVFVSWQCVPPALGYTGLFGSVAGLLLLFGGMLVRQDIKK
jgi:hypothetical protein